MSSSWTRDAYFFSTRAQATSSRLNAQAAGALGYADNAGVAQAAVTSGSVAISNCSVTVPVIHTNRVIRVIGQVTVTNTVASMYYSTEVMQNGSAVGRVGRETAQVGDIQQSHGGVILVFPTFASNVVFSLQMTVESGTGSLAIANSSPAHAWIFVEDIGAQI